MLFKIVLSLLALSQVGIAYNILVFFPFAGKSHGILGDGYVRELLKDGQKVTYATPYPEMRKHENLTIVDLSDNVKHMRMDLVKFDDLINNKADFDSNFESLMYNYMINVAKDKNLVAFLSDPEVVSFDAVIVEWMFLEAFSGLAAIFDAPLIWSVSTDPFWMTLRLIDDLPNPSYTGDVLSPYNPPLLTLYERLHQLFYMVRGMVFMDYALGKLDTDIYENYLRPIAMSRGKNLPPLEEARYNASLMLGNSHVSMGAAVTLPQSFKPIGGYHIDPVVKTLSDNLKKIMDEAKHGVIYVSMGSNLKSNELPDAIKRDLLKVFGELKQTVIWKFEEELPGAPGNLHIVDWAPQPSILNHPNCVLFITHGGLLSTTEAIHYGVPIIGMPVFADQPLNVERAVSKGFAKRVDWSYEAGKHLKKAIEEILSDPTYSERVQYMSRVYHNRPSSPQSELAHWVRHVAATRGAPHLRSPAMPLRFYQKLYLDAAALLLATLLVLRAAGRRLLTKLLGKNKDISTKKRN